MSSNFKANADASSSKKHEMYSDEEETNRNTKAKTEEMIKKVIFLTPYCCILLTFSLGPGATGKPR
jgi:hypothetical protein